MKYFAYGSNMDPVGMSKRCPEARALGAAVLRGHRMIFTYDSALWRGGVASVVPSAGDDVWGVLWEIDDVAERALDRYEGVEKDAYRKERATVEHAGAPVDALIYVATSTEFKKPSARYTRALVDGARAHALPEDYVARLAAIA